MKNESWDVRMAGEMVIAGLSERTREAYLRAARQLAKFHQSTDPGTLEEQHIKDYLLWLRTEKRAAPGTLRIASNGIRFFYRHACPRDWITLLTEVVTVSRTGESLILGSRKEPENGEGEHVEWWKVGTSSLHERVPGRSSSDDAGWSFGGVGGRTTGVVRDEHSVSLETAGARQQWSSCWFSGATASGS